MTTMDTGQPDRFDQHSLLEFTLPPEGRVQLQGDHDDGRGLVLVLWHANSGTAGMLDREKVKQLHAALDEWLVDTEPEPDIPGRPL